MARIIPRRTGPVAPACTVEGSDGGGGATGITFESGFSGSGTFASGNTVTITRAAGGWGTKPGGGKPLLWIPLDADLAPDATYSRQSPTLTAQVGCTYQTTVKPAGATGCAQQDVASLELNKAALFSQSPPFVFGDGENPAKLYVYVKRYHDHADNNGEGGPCNDKTIRLWGASGSGDGSGHTIYYSIGASLNLDFIEGVTPDVPESGERYYNDMSFGGYDNDDFVVCEHVFKEGTIDTFDGIWSNIREGRMTHLFTDNWVTRDDVSDPLMATFYLDQFSNGTYVGNIYFHSLYIDNSHARVFASDESTFKEEVDGIGDRYHREIQIPTVWADDEITCLLRNVSAGDYLYVATDDNTVTKVGQFT